MKPRTAYRDLYGKGMPVFLALILFIICGRVAAQNDRVIQRMFLVGDAGEIREGRIPVCDWLKEHVDWNDTGNVLVYLGDNIYPKGMPPLGSKDRSAAEKILNYQLSVVAGKKAHAYFIPGNHDWKRGRPGGWEQVKNENAYIDSLDLPNVEELPKDGCPGPVEVAVGERMVLVCMDSEWWLQQQDDRPGSQSACDCRDERTVITTLKDIINTYPDKIIVLAMHHPFYSHGEHGGYFTIRQHIFPLTDFKHGLYIPLPVIGSIYPIARGVFGNIQDIHNPRYKELIQRVEEVIKGHKHVIRVAGHDHTLQLLERDSAYYVVSGAGSKHAQVKMGKYSLFAKNGLGFAVIEMMESGHVTIKFCTPDARDLDQSVYAAVLPSLSIPAPEANAGNAVAGGTPGQTPKAFPDSVTVTPAPYFQAGGFKRFLLGGNYRKEWATPVRVKVFDMTGWEPLRRGGGMQTRSLRLRGTDGKEYVLRSVEKYVSDAALPEEFRGTFVKDLVSDGVSASYPFAALSIPPFADAVHVPHAHPQLVYMPDDPRLGKFRSDYGNMLALFEEREPGSEKKTYSTDDLDKRLQKDNDNNIDQHRVLQARLLDMFFMDFDRHEDQWRWAAEDNGKGKTFSPVPRDRDQPFFINSGLIPYFVGAPYISPQLQGFRAKARNIKTFNFNARHFDHNYMNELSGKDWETAARLVLAAMTDSLIEHSLRLQPLAVQRYSVGSIIAKLKERRKYYVGEMMEYYRFLARTVTVYGSDKRELFDVRREDGAVTVTIYKLNKEGEASRKLYERKFLAGETREIRLFGLGGDDQFRTQGQGAPSICVRMIGGPGNDVFDNASGDPAGKTRIYDVSTEQNQLTGNGRYRSFVSSDPAVNAVNRRGFKYNVLAPRLDASYNPDDGVYLGLHFKYAVQGFHKDPYKQLHQLSIVHSLATKAYHFKYNFEATRAIGKADLLVDVDVRAPNHTINFFKYGNETVFDKSGSKDIQYYRTRFNLIDLGVGLRGKFSPVLSLEGGPAFQYFSMDSADNGGRFITHPSLNGLDPATLFRSKTYLGGQVAAIIDNRNNKVLPSRGINWQTRFRTYGALSKTGNPFSQLNSDLSLFTSFNSRANLVIANRIGYGKTFGNYEFFQAQNLGETENLRGYRKTRFAGDEMLYHNLELRIKVADFQTYVLPGSFGILLFNDIGRVWLKGETSHQWHDGYGGGIWISPLKRFVLTAAYSRGTDGGAALITWGFQY